MSWMFSGLENLTSLDLSHLNTSNVTNIEGMFAFSGITSLDLSSFDTSNVTNMSQLFDNCTNLVNLNLNNFNFNNVTDIDSIDGLGYYLDSLKNVYMLNVIIGKFENSFYFLPSSVSIPAHVENMNFSVVDVDHLNLNSFFYYWQALNYLDLINLQ